jgi:hypothetical protein
MNNISNYYATRKDSIDIPIANELAFGKVVVINDSNRGGNQSFLLCSDKNCGWKCKYFKSTRTGAPMFHPDLQYCDFTHSLGCISTSVCSSQTISALSTALSNKYLSYYKSLSDEQRGQLPQGIYHNLSFHYLLT